MWNFMKDTELGELELTNTDKKSLYKILWQNRYVEEYAQKVNLPISLESRKAQFIDKVMEYLTKSILKTTENTDIIEALKDLDHKKFYAIPRIEKNKEEIFDFLKK